MFNLNIKTAGKKNDYKPLSICVKYLVDEKKLPEKLENLEKIFSVGISSLQKKNFLYRIKTFR